MKAWKRGSSKDIEGSAVSESSNETTVARKYSNEGNEDRGGGVGSERSREGSGFPGLTASVTANVAEKAVDFQD